MRMRLAPTPRLKYVAAGKRVATHELQERLGAGSEVRLLRRPRSATVLGLPQLPADNYRSLFGCFRTNKVANVLCIKRGPVRLSVMRAIKRADRPRRHHESGKDPPGLAIPAGLTLASDLPEKRQKFGPRDASDIKSSGLTSPTNPRINRTAETRRGDPFRAVTVENFNGGVRQIGDYKTREDWLL